jgi:anti-sigma factor ChrR (cupin superfamily)
LDSHEEKQLAAHLASGCEACQQALTATARVLRALPFALLSPIDSAVELPAALKQRLLDSIKKDAGAAAKTDAGPQIWKAWPDTQKESSSRLAGLLTVQAHEGVWEEIGINGIKVKRLFVDKANDSATMLVRMPAGASYPRHRHAGIEQCYVLEGDLRVDDAVFRAGDYQCADSNSTHGVQYTESGCLLLIVSSLHDEILEA